MLILCLLLLTAGCGSGTNNIINNSPTLSNADVTTVPPDTYPPSSSGISTTPSDSPAATVTQEPSKTTTPSPDTPENFDNLSVKLSSITPFVLAKPSFDGQKSIPSQTTGTKPYLSIVSQKTNNITDEAVWIKQNQLKYPFFKFSETHYLAGFAKYKLPSTVPTAYNGNNIRNASFDSKNVYLVYGDYEGKNCFLFVVDRSTSKIKCAYSFVNYLYVSDWTIYFQEVMSAAEENGILYVSTSHLGYSKDTNGKNAYITAINTSTNKAIWRTGALICNSRNFIISGDYIISGYGFSSEDDFMYIIDKSTGTGISKLKVKTGPDFIIPKDGKLFVRCYDTDYVFSFVK